MTVAHAAPNTTVNVMGTVNATTCDVTTEDKAVTNGELINVGGGSNGIVDLGEVEITDFEKKTY